MSSYEFVKIDVPNDYAPLARAFASYFMQMQHKGAAPPEVAAFVAMGMVLSRGAELPTLADKPFGEVAKVAFGVVNAIMHAEGAKVGDDDEADSEPTDAEKAAEEAREALRFAALKPRGAC